MTVLKYLMSTGVCTTAELIAFKKADPTGEEYRKLAAMAAEEMQSKGIEIEVADAKH
jgi:hypothetical protein